MHVENTQGWMQCTRPPEPAELPNSTLSSDQPAAHGQKRSDETEHGDSPKHVKFADASFSLLENTFLVDDSATGESVQKTPKLDEDAKQKSLIKSPAQTYLFTSTKMTL